MEVFANEDILIKIEQTHFAQDAAIKHLRKMILGTNLRKKVLGSKYCQRYFLKQDTAYQKFRPEYILQQKIRSQ